MMRVKCNRCGSEFDEDRIGHDMSLGDDIECCPVCRESGALMDLGDPDDPEGKGVVPVLKIAHGKAVQLANSLDFLIYNRPTVGDLKNLSNLTAEVMAYLDATIQKLQGEKE